MDGDVYDSDPGKKVYKISAATGTRRVGKTFVKMGQCLPEVEKHSKQDMINRLNQNQDWVDENI